MEIDMEAKEAAPKVVVALEGVPKSLRTSRPKLTPSRRL